MSEMRNNKLAPMASSSSSKSNNKQEQPHLSGAYIRSLVKQLSSTSTARAKDHSTMSSKPHNQPEDQPQTQIAPPQQQPHKKQVRRRLHTSRPYQERLLNMAEARREIVTALKIHRASMRQAKEQQQQQQMMQLHLQQQQEVHAVQEPSRAQIGASLHMSYSSYSSDYLYNPSFAHFTAPSSYSSPLSYHTPVAPIVNPDHDFGHMVPLPAQPPLGLNLSFQSFNSVDTKNSTCSFDPPPLLQPSPTSSYSVYSSPPVIMSSNDLSAVTMENTSLAADASLHRALDDEEMAAIYSIGEWHDVEWSDTMNLVTTAWWSNLLESIEGNGDGTVGQGQRQGQEAGEEAANTTKDPLLEMSDWFSDSLGHQATKESSSDVLGMKLSDYYQHNEDVTLPDMDIGEFEGWDAEWFS